MIVSDSGPNRHRLARGSRGEVAGVHRSVIQDHAVRDVVDVVPHDHLTGGQGRRTCGDPGSSSRTMFWIPAFAGMTALRPSEDFFVNLLRAAYHE